MIKIKHALTLVLLSLSLAINPAKADANTGDTLKSIHEMRVLNYAILSDYYMFSGLEGDTRYSREIDAEIKQFENLLSEATDGNSPSSKLEQTAALLSSWQEYKKLLDVNRTDFLSQGYANARLVDELTKGSETVNNNLAQLYSAVKSDSGHPVSKNTELTRQMGVIIQALTAEYAARSTSSLGQVMVIDINEGGMDKQADKFRSLLDELKSSASKDKSIYRDLDQVGVKWEFIAKSISNYNENAVPFVITTYGDRIAKDLVSIGDFYAKSLQAKK
ncbi:hypothetical protein [Bermanella sp. R86510]|uniref:hypothetical protein n=1 Tax=unclassified Bermanella TaxID=2627862 RepID=UPI0037C513B0